MAIRVLALCGFTQNSYIYSRQIGAVRKACKNVEFVFLEPPVVVEKADLPWSDNLDQFGSNATTDEAAQTAETTPRAWWVTANEMKTYKKFDETVAYVHDFLTKNGPFDGIMGFSQGAGMAAIICALLEKPGLHPNWQSEPSLPKFKFAIFVGGFLPKAESHDFTPYFPLPSSLATLHVCGKNDTLITVERSKTLSDKCENARVEEHDGGHYTPSKASWRHFFNAYINSFGPDGSNGDVPEVNSFGPSGANTPVSSKGGANTPRPSTPAQ
ncbi:uncharacterized protein L201_002809 [Kwoniella dendrophila CBS 6074]|uniref:Serine hydrolase domain-containing protein n=1 Tax=Kwoniella dendrophila CBS 6074 TaxID=1295534 RepID=A0AAX4JT29_9TREE